MTSSAINTQKEASAVPVPDCMIREATLNDVESLHALEEKTFTSDKLSKRRFKHWINADNRVFLVATLNGALIGYGLVLLNKGTRLARLYSLAISQEAKGLGLGRKLLNALEGESEKSNRLYMRLEVAVDNIPAIKLYQSAGYITFDCKQDYYEDHRDALRMQKRIRYLAQNHIHRSTPWYQQTTEFTCGPASLLMAMSSLTPELKIDQKKELDIWRKATTIFMTSGHGGCHPVGLALSAKEFGFNADVYINQQGPLFLDGVRSTAKKDIMSLVDEQFHEKAEKQNIKTHFKDVAQQDIEAWLKDGASIVILISSFRIDGKKAPHWVTVSGIDDVCIYLHDPDPPDDNKSLPIDCQYIPIAREDFAKMSAFGREKLRTCVVLYPPEKIN